MRIVNAFSASKGSTGSLSPGTQDHAGPAKLATKLPKRSTAAQGTEPGQSLATLNRETPALRARFTGEAPVPVHPDKGGPGASTGGNGPAAAGQPAPLHLTDPLAASGFVASSGVGSMLNESLGTRPKIEVAEHAKREGIRHVTVGEGSDRPEVILYPEEGGYLRYEYEWNATSRQWTEVGVEVGGPDGTINHFDHQVPDNNWSNVEARAPADNRSAYERMREHYDPNGDRLNGYPNTIQPGMFPDGPIGPDYRNYPVEPDPLIQGIADIFGLSLPFPIDSSPESALGQTLNLGQAAYNGSIGVGAFVPASPTDIGLGAAATALGWADKHKGGPTLEGPNPQYMESTGLPRSTPNYSSD